MSAPLRCQACGRPAINKCVSCLSVAYCGPGCQRADWKNHKGPCKATAALRVEELIAAAESGDAVAQRDLAQRLKEGWGVAKNPAESLRWYRLSAAAGEAVSALNLGAALIESSDTAAEGVSWLQKAADAGVDIAVFNLGVCFMNGTGVKKDAARAVELYLRAAKAGCVLAQNALAECYDLGQGIRKSDAEAVSWYQRAADAGHAGAQAELGLRFMEGRGVRADPARAEHYWQAAAEAGDSGAQFNLGLLKWQSSAPGNAEKGVAWWQRAAKRGHAKALFNLGEAYRLGRGVERDAAQAARFLRSAAEAGHVDAMFNLAACYLTGERGMNKDDALFAEWLRRAQMGSLAAGTGLWAPHWPQIPGITRTLE